MELTSPLSVLTGVGPKIAECLRHLELNTLQDLLFHLPSRYQDRTRITSIGALREGDYVLIEGEIQSSTISPGRRPNLLCQLRDNSGSIYVRFFHFSAQQKNQLSSLGSRLLCFGEVRRGYRHFGFEMIHPEYRYIQEVDEIMLDKNLTPIYPTTQGLSQPLLRRLTDQALQILQDSRQNIEFLPETILKKYQLADLVSALIYVHRPPADANVDLLLSWQHPLQKRLAFEELIAHQLTLQKLRWQAQQQKALALVDADQLRHQFLSQLSFQLTTAQQRVVAEIDRDLSRPCPMLRLLQGDVGSGKTVVAAMAILRAISQNAQAALMAPTELLAEQHYQNFSAWFAPLGIQVSYLSGRQPTAVRHRVLSEIANGDGQLLIGTHALFQDDVHFKNLVLLIIDEQHRFGVNQRLALKAKGIMNDCFPHQLIMSATPIPRTLAMAVYADLDLSVIDQLPPGRQSVVTALISNQRRDEVIERVRLACKAGKQVYWVCTLIQDSEDLQCKAAEATAQTLQNRLTELKIGLLHSRISADQKNAQMQAFKNAQIDLLVATTVIEVGVDVANASLMIIENPERLGLAQLHQLRGRVGRGSAKSFCILLFQEPLSAHASQRLQVLRNTNDGFAIAREDLKLRGPGEVLGTRQSGILSLKMADLMRDQHLMPEIQSAAQILIKHYPQQTDALISRWIGSAKHYMQV